MQTRHHALCPPSLGTTRSLTSFHFGQPGSGQKIHIQASLHADELPGMLTAWHLKKQLLALETAGRLRGEIILVPMANPIGLDQSLYQCLQGRFELQSGQNFNRHYPVLAPAIYRKIGPQLGDDAAANTALIRQEIQRQLAAMTADTELQSLRLTLMRLAADADVVLDLHCDARADLHVYTGTPLWPQCEPLARALQACASLLATESGEFPFDEACSQIWWQIRDLAQAEGRRPAIDMACLAVTVELRGEGDVNHEWAARDAAGILDFLRHRGVIDEPAPALPPLRHPATPLAGSEDLRAPHAGVVAYHARPGAVVQAGTLIAEVIDPLTDTCSEVRARHEGMLYATSDRTYATSGLLLAKVATAQAFKTGNLLTA